MKLRTRLMVAFFTVVLTPIILFGAAIFGFSKFQLKSIEKSYGVELSLESLSNSVPFISKSTEEICEQMREMAYQDPDRFLNFSYLQELNNKLDETDSYLILRRDSELYYTGTEADVQKLFQQLPAYGDSEMISDSGTYIGRDVKALVKQVDLKFSDQSQGSAFIVTSTSKLLPQMRSLLMDMGVAILVILIITAAIMTFWIYTGINTPLNKLKEATQRIKEGDLDFNLEAEGDGEISALCRDFEAMRKRLKESEDERERYDLENRELISNISHDLKTPITTVKGYVEGIMDGVADTPEKMERYIKTIYNKANDMDRLINELTFYSKIDTNRIPYTFNKINVAEYFDDCAEEVCLDLEGRNIRFTYLNQVDKNTMVIADAEQMKRVINNIIGNSIKYMDKPKGQIELRILDAGDFIQVELEDNGKGIDVKDLPSIFDRFYRTDASRNSAQGGSGIGLSIVRKIIEDHGGKIWASSKLGKGTTMCFVLRKYQEVPL